VSRLKDELLDPWGPLVGGVLGAAAVASGAPLLVGLGIGATVYGVKALVGGLMRDHSDELPGSGSLPPLPRTGTAARHWLDRAANAVAALERMAPRTSVTATDVAAAHTAEEARGVLATMRRLGGQCLAVSSALSHADAPGLDAEAVRLQQLATATPHDRSAAQSAQAVADRIAVRDRLRKAQAELEGRLQSSALSLEGLVARVAEVQAAASAVGQLDPTADDLKALTQEVEGLRVGLADVEQVAQRALGSS
jgi:hypothetical protein